MQTTSKTILQINSSARSNGNANALADQFVGEWLTTHAQDKLIKRDVGANPLPHLTEELIGAFFTPAEQRTTEQAELVQRSDQLIAELQAADVLVLGVPMYNFGIPSTLKSYFDHIARAGVTFRYTANGPEGLVKGKKAYVLAARGGLYQGTPKDSQTTYLRDFLAFIGIDEVEFVYAEGLNMGAEQHDQAQAAAQQRIAELAH